MPDVQEVRAAVAGARWYHTIDLPGGIVTPGEYDLRRLPARLPIPASLRGRRALDVGTRDGFWAFTLEERGAERVVGIDLADPARLDWPEPRPELPEVTLADLDARSRAFHVARAARGSAVERVERSVYDLDPAVDGTFDFAFLGTLLLHLRDPIGALLAIRRVMAPGGELLVNDVVQPRIAPWRRAVPRAVLSTLPGPYWWTVDRAGLRSMITKAGFTVTAVGRPYLMPHGGGMDPPGWRGPWSAAEPLAMQVALRFGAPQVWVRATRA